MRHMEDFNWVTQTQNAASCIFVADYLLRLYWCQSQQHISNLSPHIIVFDSLLLWNPYFRSAISDLERLLLCGAISVVKVTNSPDSLNVFWAINGVGKVKAGMIGCCSEPVRILYMFSYWGLIDLLSAMPIIFVFK